MEITCPNRAIITFKSGDNVDSLYGENVYAVVLDEATRMRSEVWTVVRSTVTATQAPIKIIGNFVGVSNWVHKLAEKAKTDTNYSYFKVNAYDAVEAGILELKEVEQAKIDLPERTFQELYLAMAFEGEDQLIKLKSMLRLFDGNGETGDKAITCDVARHGSDKAVIMVWDGLKVIYIESFDTCDTDELADRIKELEEIFEVERNNIVVDTDGLGGGVADLVKGCYQFHNGATALEVKGIKEQYRNLKAQCCYMLSEAINEDRVNIDCTGDPETERLIVEELEQIQSVEGAGIKLDVKPKKLIKKDIGRSPDYSDTIMMRMVLFIKVSRKYESLGAV